jgi:hypothetical protein
VCYYTLGTDKNTYKRERRRRKAQGGTLSLFFFFSHFLLFFVSEGGKGRGGERRGRRREKLIATLKILYLPPLVGTHVQKGGNIRQSVVVSLFSSSFFLFCLFVCLRGGEWGKRGKGERGGEERNSLSHSCF